MTEVFYSHILNMNRRSLHGRSFRHIHFFVTLWTQKVSGSLEKQSSVPDLDPGAGLSVGPGPDLSPGRAPGSGLGPGLGPSPFPGPVLEMGPGPGLDPGAGLGLDPGLRPGPGL